MESAWPRTIAASRFDNLRGGSGNRALPGPSPGRSAANVTSSSGCLAIARRHDVTARLNGSVGASRPPDLPLLLVVIASGAVPYRLAQRHVDGRLRQLSVKAALIELGDEGSLEFVALGQEGDAEGEADVAEDLR